MAKYVRVKNHTGKTFILFGGMYGVYKEVQQKCQQAGVPIELIYGWRGKAEQDAFFAQGLSKAKFGSSPHNYGLAFDYCPLDQNGKFVQYEAVSTETWNKIGAIVRDCGLTWGGDFKTIVDLDHAENADWQTLTKDGTCPLLSEEPSDVENV